MAPAKQIPLELPHQPSFDMADFVVSSSNDMAFSLIDQWPEWPSHALALIGPGASGKTHLAKAWAGRAAAQEIDASAELEKLEAGASFLVEDADQPGINQELIFHLFNWTKETGGSLLVTGRIPPTKWTVDLPDLKSRLATIPVAEMQEPDDHLLMVLLVKLFSDRQLQVDLAVIDYVVRRIERSYIAAWHLVELLDRKALADKRKITKHLAKTCLDELAEG